MTDHDPETPEPSPTLSQLIQAYREGRLIRRDREGPGLGGGGDDWPPPGVDDEA